MPLPLWASPAERIRGGPRAVPWGALGDADRDQEMEREHPRQRTRAHEWGT